MISVKLQGGLGNQLFQFAVGFNLARRLETELQLELSFYDHHEASDGFTPRKFLLNELGIPVKRLSITEWSRRKSAPDISLKVPRLQKLCADLFSKPKQYVEQLPRFDPSLFNMRGNIHLEGYFQDYRYIENATEFIKCCINARRSEALTKSHLQEEEAICLHVRRGDYITRPDVQELMGRCDASYYRGAVHWLRAQGINGPIYAFSDDKQYAQKAFSDIRNLTVWNAASGQNGPVDEFLVMMRCRHFIIANSSFSYWAALLGADEQSRVCCPDPWYAKPAWSAYTPVPPGWRKFSRE
jgi:hypothetical protein